MSKMLTARVSIANKTALVVVALAVPGRSATEEPTSLPTFTPTSSPTEFSMSMNYDDDYPSAYNPDTTSVCEGSTPNFKDSFGDGCWWYEWNDLPGCPEHGDFYAGTMGTPRENCCYCWMDAPTSAPTTSKSPTLAPMTSAPTVSTSPTLTPEPPTSYPTFTPSFSMSMNYDDDDDYYPSPYNPDYTPACEGSTPNFKDSYGDGCWWYEKYDNPGCPQHGDFYAGPMGTPRENCCYCWMDAMTSAPTVSANPTLAPTTSSPTPPPPEIEDYEYMGRGFCTSADDENPFNDDPFINNGLFGFDYTHAWEASTLEECTSACAASHSNDPLFRGVTWMDPSVCFCLKGWEGEEAGASGITGIIDLFLDDVLCYAYTPESTESQESSISGLWGSLFGG